MSNKILMVILSLGICICSDQDRFFINHLIENDREVHRPFNNEPISGKVYRSFSEPITEPKFVGMLRDPIKKVYGAGGGTMRVRRSRANMIKGSKMDFGMNGINWVSCAMSCSMKKVTSFN